MSLSNGRRYHRRATSSRRRPSRSRDIRTEGAGGVRDLGYVAVAICATDRRAAVERIRDLTERVGHYSVVCGATSNRISDLEAQRDHFSVDARGVRMEAVAAVGAATILLEFVPASLFTQIFVYTSDATRMLLTITFTTIGAIGAAVVGELLHRRRTKESQRAVDSGVTFIVIVFVVAFLIVGYNLRRAYTSVVGPSASSSVLEATALTLLAAMGVCVTAVSAYYRESPEMFANRRELHRARRNLESGQLYLRNSERDLLRARALQGNFEYVSQVAPTNPSLNT